MGLPSRDKRLDADVRDGSEITPSRRREIKRRIEAGGMASASRLIGPIQDGDEIHGLTNGQFSLIDMIEHVLDCSGPADVVISTWTMGVYDQDHARTFFEDGRIKRIRWIVDPSMFGRRAALAGALVDAFGADSFRAVNTHAKFTTIESASLAVVIRTSMNLNRNERMESFDLSADRELAAFYRGVVDEIFEKVPAKSRTQSKEFFEGLLAAFESEKEAIGSGMKTYADLAAGLKEMAA